MSSSLSQKIKIEIQIQIDLSFQIDVIQNFTNVNQIQIDKMKRNLKRYDSIFAISTMQNRFRKMNVKMKNFFLNYINLHSIKFFDEMC